MGLYTDYLINQKSRIAVASQFAKYPSNVAESNSAKWCDVSQKAARKLSSSAVESPSEFFLFFSLLFGLMGAFSVQSKTFGTIAICMIMLKILQPVQIGMVSHVCQQPQQSISSTESMNIIKATQYPANGPRKEMVITDSYTLRSHAASQKASDIQIIETGAHASSLI